MVPISTTLPMTASTMVTALGAELHAGKEGGEEISSGAGASQIKITGAQLSKWLWGQHWQQRLN